MRHGKRVAALSARMGQGWRGEGHGTVSMGTVADYHALARHHYCSDRPATVSRVLTVTDASPSVAGRWVGRAHEPRVVAVLVESMPTLNCAMRDWVLGERYRAWPAGPRAALLREELRCISRVIVHPSYRGSGLAARLVRAALDSAATPLTEAMAAMGRVHPFFEKAGMPGYGAWRSESDARFLAALRRVGFSRMDLALVEDAPQAGLARRISALPTAERDWLLRELRRWYRRMGRPRDEGIDDMLKAARRRLLLSPVYYLSDNRRGPLQESHVPT